MKVLIFIDWFLPAYKAGGPVQSVFNLVDRLKDEFDFYIVTSDRDLGNDHTHKGVELNKWTSYKGVNVYYLTPENQKYTNYKELLEENDYSRVYLNSMFSIKFSFLPLIASLRSPIKVVLAPRGMLGAGALQLGKLKKSMFISLFKLFGMQKKIAWQATAQSEYDEIESVFGEGLSIKIAPNLSKRVENISVVKRKKAGQANLFFLSRVSRKKNLIAVINYLSKVRASYNIKLDIIGPIEDEDYWGLCQSKIRELGENISVNYIGSVPNVEITSKLIDSHFMILPTFNENFGHVIMEAWQNACPVIISDQTPWKGLENKNVGWDIPLENEYEFVEAIEKAAQMNDEEYKKWSNDSFLFSKEFCDNPELLEKSKELFN